MGCLKYMTSSGPAFIFHEAVDLILGRIAGQRNPSELAEELSSDFVRRFAAHEAANLVSEIEARFVREGILSFTGESARWEDRPGGTFLRPQFRSVARINWRKTLVLGAYPL